MRLTPASYRLKPSWPEILCVALHRLETRLRARRLSQPAAGPANGGGSEVLSVVPPGGSSEAVCSEQLRIDWSSPIAQRGTNAIHKR
jgi:hypothetical protein